MTRTTALNNAWQRIKSWIRAYVVLSVRSPWWVLGAAFISTIVAAVAAQNLQVNPRLDALLPTDTVSARSIDEMSRRVRSTSPLYLLVKSSDLETSRRLATKLYEEVGKWPEVEWVMQRRDPSYFTERRLLLLPTAELESFTDDIEERVRWEECSRMPGCVNIDDEAPALPAASKLQNAFGDSADLKMMASVLGTDASVLFKSDSSADGTQAKPSAEGPGGSSDAQAAAVEATRDAHETQPGELCDASQNVCVVQASLRGDPSSLEFAAAILERSEALFASLESRETDEALKFAVSGQYRNGPMTRKAVIEDLAKTTLLSTFLVFLVVWSQFRGFRSLVVLFLPIFSSIAWTGGLLYLFHPSLNLISAFTMAILTGMGIDFGLHLLTHYTRERDEGLNVEQALLHTFGSVGPSLFVAAGTTALGFGALAVASFRGFSEMGPIAAFGVMAALGGFLLLLPPLVAVFDRSQTCPFAMRSYGFNPWPLLRRSARPIVLVGGVLTVGLAATAFGVGGRGLEFEYDFQKLDASDVGHGISWSKSLHGTNRTAIYLMADDAAALEEVAAVLRKDPPAVLTGDKPMALVIPGAFIPNDQPAKLHVLKRLRKTLERAKSFARPDLQSEIDRLLPLTRIETPIDASQMPQWVSEWLFEKNGAFGTLGILYTDFRGSDARQMEVLVHELEALRGRFPKVRFASTVAQLGEVTPRLRQEAPLIIGLAIIGAAMGTILLGRNWWRIIAVLLPMFVMTGVSLGLAALFGVKVNLYNMLVFPLAFGIGIDGAVYVDWAFAQSKSAELLPTASRAVLGATLTSIAGFGALIWSRNPGLASIGLLATLMLGTALVANLVWLPGLFWLSQKSPRDPDGPGAGEPSRG
jgi:uncharacterized protein